MFLLSSADIFQNQLFQKMSFRNTIRVSDSLDPDQTRRFVGPDLGTNCLQRLSADDTSRHRVDLRQNTKSSLTESKRRLYYVLSVKRERCIDLV